MNTGNCPMNAQTMLELADDIADIPHEVNLTPRQARLLQEAANALRESLALRSPAITAPPQRERRADLETRIERALLDDELFGVGCENQDQLEAAANFSATFIANAILADQPQREPDALGYATRLLEHFVAEHFPHNPAWKPLPDLIGVLTQLDNVMTIARDYKEKLRAYEGPAHTRPDGGDTT